MEISLKGKVAVVTGAASGIGLATAQTLAEAGASVMLTDLNADGLSSSAQALEGQGHSVAYHPADVSDAEQVRQLMAHTIRSFGRIDILINNAGLQYVAPIVDFPEEKWDLLVNTMLKGPFLCTKYAMPSMIERKWGRIVNIGSIHSRVASAYKCAYVAAKFGVAGLTRVTALEGAPHNITCNALCPSYVRTPIVERQIESQAKLHNIPPSEVIDKIMLANAPIKRLLEPAEVAAVVLFLCSDYAAGMTGSEIPMDCGWTAH